MQTIVNKPIKNEFLPTTIKIFREFFINNLFLVITVCLLLLKSLIFLCLAASSAGRSAVLSALYYFDRNFLIHLGFIILLVSVSYLFKGKLRINILLFLNFILSLLLFFDTIYYRGFQEFISMYDLSQTGNLNGLTSSIISMMRPVDIIFFIDIIVLLIIKRGRFKIDTNRSIPLFIITAIIGGGIPFYYHYKYDILKEGGYRRYFYSYFSPVINISDMSPIGYHINDIYTYVENSKRLTLSDADKLQIKNWYESNKENLPDNKYKAMFKGKNLIIMQVESLENFVVGQKVGNEEITPNLNKLLKNSLYFSQIYEQVSGGNSSDADLMTNTSIHPVRNGATFFRFPDNTYNSLPILMKKQGYYTSAFHPDGGGYWNWMPGLKAMGFDKCTDTVGFKVDETIGLGLSDGSYLRQLKDKLIQQPQPFYSFFVTLTSHMPFDLPQNYREMKLPDNIGSSVLGDYFQSIRYTDTQIGKFLDGLDKAGILKNSVVVIYGDHTGVHKYYQDKLKSIQPREDWWYQKNMRVPLIIYSEGMEGKKVDTIGGEIDILPTVSYLMGVNEKDYTSTATGRNLLKTNRNFTVLSNGVYIGDYKNEEEKKKAVEALDISDKIIRSDYFKYYK